ncbi:MAG TPA: helix-turn-helix transcriptional regulator [Streptosporangiaceae bacterium]|nr:helix-turn-helix transcriptional regulator [Streptosporangiaceae bacterium]
MGFAERLAELMAERGISGRGLARLLPCDRSYVSLLTQGKRRASPQMAARIDALLGAGGELAALAAASETAPGDRERLAWAREHPRRVDLAAVESLAGVLAAQRHAEDTLGSAAILRPVMAHLAAVGDLVTEACGPVRAALVDVAGQWAQFAGWLNASVRKDATAIRLCDLALGWATEAGDVNMVSQVVSMKGHVAWMDGHPGPVIGLSQAAQRDPRAFAGQHAISAAQEARGHAMTGDADAAERKLDDAMASAQAADEQHEESPPWLYYHSPAYFQLQRGIVLGYFAKTPRYRDIALAALETGYAGLPPDEQASEWGAAYLVHMAAVHERSGDADRAAAVALDAARVVRQTGSPRLRGMLGPQHRRMAARWPDHPGVAMLGEALT